MRPKVKYQAIHANRGKCSIIYLCHFFGVSRSGYYAWLKHKDEPDKDAAIAALIQHCQEKTRQTYGYRRVRLWLRREHGFHINHKAVLRLMRKYGLLAVIRRPRPLYQRQQKMNLYENILNRNFVANKPNQKWVTDISYIHTGEGVLYLSCIKDLYDNFIVACDMATKQDNALVYRTIQKTRKEVANGLILHSDQGFQYTSQGYLKLTKDMAFCLPCQGLPRRWTMRLRKTSSVFSKQSASTVKKLILFNRQNPLSMTISISTISNVSKRKVDILPLKSGVCPRNSKLSCVWASFFLSLYPGAV